MESEHFVYLMLLAVIATASAWLAVLWRLVRAMMESEPDLWFSLGAPNMSPGALVGRGVPAWGAGFMAWVRDGGPGARSPKVLRLVKWARGLMFGTLAVVGLTLWCAWGLLAGGSGAGGVRTGG